MDLTDRLLEDSSILYEYTYPKKSSARFTYHKHKDPKDAKKFVDNGICEVCGRRGINVLVEKDKPVMCYKCYTAIRAYRKLTIDTLKLQKKKTLNVKQAKKIVHYMKTYAKKRNLAIGLVATYLLTKDD